MKNNETKQINRKALPKFIFIVIVGAVIGGIMGYLSAEHGLNELTESLKEAGHFFGMHLSHWLMMALMILLPAICVPSYHSARKMLETWNGEDEEISDTIDRKISVVLWISSGALILSLFLIAASYSGGFSVFDNKESTFALFSSVAAFFVIMVEAILIQQKCIDTVRQINPEKKVSVYDMKFQKKWVDSCDEAEKIVIGKCAFKAYSSTNMLCVILAVILAISAFVFKIGFLPSLMVCLVWFVNISIYSKEAIRYSKAGNKIS